MPTKLLVTLSRLEDAQAVRASGCEVLAQYPDSMVVRASDEQLQQLRAAGVEAVVLPAPTVQLGAVSFSLDDALRADEAAPIPPDPDRTSYYIVQLIGPPAGSWIDTIEATGGAVHGTFPDFGLLVGLPPGALAALARQPWVEAVTPYRPAMKVSPKLRPGAPRTLTAGELTVVDLGSADPDERRQVEVSVFPGESTEAVAARVRDGGGTVLRDDGRKVRAVVGPATLGELADRPEVQAILPDALPELHNDRATMVMGAPPDRCIGPFTLTGAGQVVAVADTGLDTGNPRSVHVDVQGRIVDIVSWPNQLADLCNDPPPFDDGPADDSSGHGTHVVGSVLGDGSAGREAGDESTVPVGMAPEARAYVQAIDQNVTWKSADELRAMGMEPPVGWPFPAWGLYGLPDDLSDLLQPAYDAGARIHTNSWGADAAGLYNMNAREVDEFLWRHRDMLVLFSAGNAGVDVDGDGQIDPDSIGSPATAKNCLTVGASENDRPPGWVPRPGRDFSWDVYPGSGPPRWPTLAAAGHLSDDPEGMAAFSSRGPTDDGRVKPDVVAPGVNVLSLRSSAWTPVEPPPPPRLPGPLWGDLPDDHPLSGVYCWSGGTSMSTPLVAGAAALVRQHLEDRGHVEPGSKPSGALVKAFLCNGASPLGGQFEGEVPQGPNPVSGFGRVNVGGSVTPPGGRTEFVDEPDQAVGTGEMRTFDADVVEPGQPLRVTLVWTDAPAPAGVGGLVNRLYLQVQAPDGAVLDGDATSFPTATNNVQQVLVDAAAEGSYRIRVRGVSVVAPSPGAAPGPRPRQDFAVAASNVTAPTPVPVIEARAVDVVP